MTSAKKLLLPVIFLQVLILKAQDYVPLDTFPGAARDDAFAEIIGDYIYYGTGYSATFQPLNDIWRYSLQRKSWEQLADAPFSPRQYVASAAVGRYIFLFGGWSSNLDFHNEVWRYDTQEQLWQRMAGFPGAPRWAGSAAVSGGMVYFGLGRDTLQWFRDWWQYQPEDDQWNQLTDLPGEGRSVAMAETVDEQIWVGLGENSAGRALRDLWIFDIASGSWVFTGREKLPALKHPATAVLHHKIYIAGGEGPDSLRTNLLELDPARPQVENLGQPGFLHARGGSMVADDCRMYLVGGLSADFERLREFGALEIDPYKRPEVDFYPNPAAGFITVRHPESAREVQVFDLRGKMVLSIPSECDKTRVSVSGLRSGIYLLRWCGEGCSQAARLLVVR